MLIEKVTGAECWCHIHPSTSRVTMCIVTGHLAGRPIMSQLVQCEPRMVMRSAYPCGGALELIDPDDCPTISVMKGNIQATSLVLASGKQCIAWGIMLEASRRGLRLDRASRSDQSKSGQHCCVLCPSNTLLPGLPVCNGMPSKPFLGRSSLDANQRRILSAVPGLRHDPLSI